MDPIAKTAYYCCGARALDARSPRPLCGDTYAQRFMDDEGRAVFARFEHMTSPNVSNAVRCRIIDDQLRERLARQPDLTVVQLGAGFDTRPFRLRGGRWIELDQPPLIALKEQKLPTAEAPNALQRVAIDFARDRLADKLAPWAGTRDAVVVMEGVSMYLTPDQWRATARTLHELLPGHTLLCDLFDATFMRRWGGRMRRAIRELGGDFTEAPDDPAAFVESLGYRRSHAASVVGRTVELGGLRTPRWLLNTLLRSLRDGYCVWAFEAV